MASTAMEIKKLKQRILGGNARTARANKNIFFAFFIKGGSIASQLLLVPLTLNYLEKTQYGIWLTLASIMGWLSFFDVGIGNGLRNKLSEALAKNDDRMARIYVSTSYALVSSIFLGVLIIFWIINPFLNWSEILNAPAALQVELSKVALFVFTCFCLQFILNIIGSIFFAHQLSAMSNLTGPLGSIISIIVIFILTKTTPGSLYVVAATFSIIPVAVLAIFHLIFFRGRFSNLSPSLKFVDFRHSKNLLGLGFQFFIIQIAGLILFASSNMIITQLFGPDEVSVYNVAYRYFMIVVMIQGIITTPYWSAITEAYFKNDIEWIRKTVKRLEIVGAGLAVISLIMLLVGDIVIGLWVGDSIKVPFSVSLATCVFVIISIAGRPYNTFVNGIGKVRLQLYSAVISIIITIPLAIFFGSTLQMGPAGVVLATICTTLPTMILWRIQYKKLLAGDARGIWNL